MGGPEVSKFLSALAVERDVAASTQNQVLSALLFLYREMLGQTLPWLDDMVRAKRPARLPVVVSRSEVLAAIRHIDGPPWLMTLLLYGAGLRLLECARLRVKDVDFARNQLMVRGGKGDKDRMVPLPAVAAGDLARHLEAVKRQHEEDLRGGAGWVELPGALGRKYPHAGREWAWQWVFPATRFYVERESGQWRRHHLHESVLQHAVKLAITLKRTVPETKGVASKPVLPRDTPERGPRDRARASGVCRGDAGAVSAGRQARARPVARRVLSRDRLSSQGGDPAAASQPARGAPVPRAAVSVRGPRPGAAARAGVAGQ